MKHLALLFSVLALGFALEVGKLPSPLILEGDTGGIISGKAFSSDILKTKVHVLFYVDPDEKELNEHVSIALKEQAFDRNKYASVAIINMAATWLPNFAISSSLKAKQEKYPDTLYVKDLQSVLVKQWDLKDDSSNIVLFDKEGKVLFIKKGKLNSEEILELISLIQDNI
ncbi:MAG: transcriptional regulator [Arcobacter sp.]|nr:MAG: transcriptional regulator [Arcobacter sp.]